MRYLTCCAATIVSLTASAAFTSSATAQGTAQQRSACMGDAFRFCSAYIPDVPRIEACLKQNVNNLDPACKSEFQRNGKTRMRSQHFRS